MFGVSAGDIRVSPPLYIKKTQIDLPPEGFFKLLFSDDKHLFIMTDELKKYPFFNILVKSDASGFMETSNRIIDFRSNDKINLGTFNLVRKLMEGKKKELFEDADESLLGDPQFFDRIQACFDYLYPSQAVQDVEILCGKMLDRLHQKILRTMNISCAIRLINAFANMHNQNLQQDYQRCLVLPYTDVALEVDEIAVSLPLISDLQKYPLEMLRHGYRLALDSVIFRDAFECLIVTKTFFNGDLKKAEHFFHHFHEIRAQMVYLKSKEISVSREHLQSVAQTFGYCNAEKIGELDKKLEKLSAKMKTLREEHREIEEKKKTMQDGQDGILDQTVIEYFHKNCLKVTIKNENEYLFARNLQRLAIQQETFHAESIAVFSREISKLCFRVLSPKQALNVIDLKEVTPFERFIAQCALDEFKRCILQITLVDNRHSFPFREDMAEWCAKLLAYYNFQINGDKIQHPFQLAAVEKGTLQNEGYKFGFCYLFLDRSPEDLQNEIRADLQICGMTEEQIGPRMEGIPNTSNTFMEMERGVLVLLKKVLKQVVRVEEIPSFNNVKIFVELIRYYWDYIAKRNPNQSIRIFLSYLDLGKSWNLHAQTPVEIERLVREKLTEAARFCYTSSNEIFLLAKVHDYEVDLEHHPLRAQRYTDVIDLPEPLYDK